MEALGLAEALTDAVRLRELERDAVAGALPVPVEVTEDTWLDDAGGEAAPVGVADPVSVGLSVRDAVRLDVADCDIVLSCESDCDGEGVSVCVIDAETEGVALGLAVPVELGVTVCEALCVKDGVLEGVAAPEGVPDGNCDMVSVRVPLFDEVRLLEGDILRVMLGVYAWLRL